MRARKIVVGSFDGGEDMKDTAELFIHVLSTPVPKVNAPSSMDYSEMMNNLPIVNTIKECKGGHFLLTESEWKILRDRLKKWLWVKMTDELMTALEAVMEAPKVELEVNDAKP